MCSVNKNPLVSIIIPVYNGSNYIKNAIESALNQTYKNIEIIVVNDGSTDETEEIVLEFGDKVRYFYKENGGVATALNLAIEKMEGEYFSWLSHDDEYLPEKVEKQINAILESGDIESVCFTEYYLDFVDLNLIKPVDYNQYTVEQLGNIKYLTLFGLINGCTLLFHKNYFDKYGTFNAELLTSQDYDIWLRMFQNSSIILIKEKLVTYRVHKGQVARKYGRFAEELDNITLEILSKTTPSEKTTFYDNEYTIYLRVINNYSSYFEVNAMPKTFEYCYSNLIKIYEEKSFKYDKAVMTELRNKILNINNKLYKKICIFGTGEHGKKVHSLLQKYLIKVDYFSDNNKELWGSLVNNVRVISPNDLASVKDDTLVILGNYYHSEVIKQQLKDLGIENIIEKSEIDNILSSELYPLEFLNLEYHYSKLSDYSDSTNILFTRFKNAIYNLLKADMLTTQDTIEAVNIQTLASENKKQNFINKLTNSENVNKIAIFAAGERGAKVYYDLLKNNIKVDLFADNNESKQGYIVDDVFCYTTNELAKIKDETLVIISILDADIIKTQLSELGFKHMSTKEDVTALFKTENHNNDNIDYADINVQTFINNFNEIITNI